ncbi:sporulation membrane protein YtaF [Desulfoscipio gibsoniae]|uniref:Putative sporulation protein YtaF n=1 Tax=Desulfoscipio gibsoniae DSM 7213 TaxID=767817 RepID=R4KEV0_9FIRM|nr:sporulation membrane protein YtaF [Desulfoscipio gibsoniae]AGL01109.1 putative sporulation protein YtaF [Desulfoscipio gibsoniae DSM 7213]
MELIALLVFALALNMDSFAAGAAYGVRNIKLPITSLAIISIMSMTAITISMVLGNAVAGYFSATFAHRLGGVILMSIGIWVLIQSLQENRKKAQAKSAGENDLETDTPDPVIQIHIRSLGLVIQILREPYRADLDRSGIISGREAVLLGLALAMDAFAAGFAVSMLGFNILYTALMVGLGHFLLTYLGLLAGMSVGTSKLNQKITTLPGFILIALGLFKMH